MIMLTIIIIIINYTATIMTLYILCIILVQNTMVWRG